MCWGSWGSRCRWGGGLGLTAGPSVRPRADSRPSWPPLLLTTLSMCPPGGGSPGEGARAGLRAWSWCPPITLAPEVDDGVRGAGTRPAGL